MQQHKHESAPTETTGSSRMRSADVVEDGAEGQDEEGAEEG